jgi:hypothetical protein
MGENGKRFIEKLIAASPTERQKFTVLGQDIYVRPMTRKVMSDAMPKDGAKRDPDYVGLFLLVHCAEDEAGNKLFAIKDIDALREAVSLALLQQIESGILGVITPSDADVERAVASDPPSASA